MNAMQRVPAGVREGGRFAAGSTNESGVALADDSPQVDQGAVHSIALRHAEHSARGQGDPVGRQARIAVAARLTVGPSRSSEHVTQSLASIRPGTGQQARPQVKEAMDVVAKDPWTEDELESQSRQWLEHAVELDEQARRPGQDPRVASSARTRRDVYAAAGAESAAAVQTCAHDAAYISGAVHAAIAEGERDPDELQMVARQASMDANR